MIAVIDANSLMADPMCTGAVWQVVAHAPSSWALRLVTTEAVVVEAVAGYGREVTQAMASLDKTSRGWGRLGAQAAADAAREQLLANANAYAEALASGLSDAGVEVVAVAQVSHTQIVERAASRRRPCDDKGDGYRDTLLWFSVLEMASATDEVVVLVTSDTDFLNAEQTDFHEHLLEDLVSLGAEGQVKLVANLSDLVLRLADRAPEEGDVKALRGELRSETVRRFVISLVSDAIGSPLDLRKCALPPRAAKATLEELNEVPHVDYNVRGGSGATGQAIADFSFEADADMLVTVPTGVLMDEAEDFRLLAKSDEATIYVTSKRLVFAGFMHLGRYDKPLGGGVTRISATPDDPGHRAWHRASAGVDLLGGLDVNLMRDVLKGINVNPVRDALKDINVNPMRDVLKGINVNLMRDVLKGIGVNPVRDALKDINVNPMRDILGRMDVHPLGRAASPGHRPEPEAGDEVPDKPVDSPKPPEASGRTSEVSSDDEPHVDEAT